MEIWANIIVLAGSLLMVSIGLIKKKQRILLVQCIQFLLLALGNALLGGFSGVIANLVSVARNLAFAKLRPTKWWKVGFIALQVGVTLLGGVRSPVEALPILASVLFTWSMDVKSVVTFKLAIVAAQVFWFFYDLFYHNYVGCAFDVLTMATNLWSIATLRKEKKSA